MLHATTRKIIRTIENWKIPEKRRSIDRQVRFSRLLWISPVPNRKTIYEQVKEDEQRWKKQRPRDNWQKSRSGVENWYTSPVSRDSIGALGPDLRLNWLACLPRRKNGSARFIASSCFRIVNPRKCTQARAFPRLGSAPLG